MKFEHSDDFLVSQVEVWNHDSILRNQDVHVKNGKIVSIHDHTGEVTHPHSIDGKGLQLIPAGVDPQVHMRVPGQEQKETAKTSLESAIKGGIAAMLAMPNTKPVLDTPEAFQAAYEEINPYKEKYGVEVLLSGAISKNQVGKEPVDFESLCEYGAAAFTDDGYGIESDEVMALAFEASEKLGLPILQHAEVSGHGCSLAAGPVQESLGLGAYPETAETHMIERDLRLLEKHKNARYHVLHLSAAKSVELIQKARHRGLKVSCEVSPHHLYFCSHDIDPKNSSFKMNPPLRSLEDRASLQKALATGEIDFVATDHAPHEPDVKGNNIDQAAFGTIGLETSLRVLIDLWQEKKLSSERLVEVFSTAPAQFLNIADRFGELKVGHDFHAVLIEATAPKSEITSDFKSLSQNSCFIGSHLPNCIRSTFLKERIYT